MIDNSVMSIGFAIVTFATAFNIYLTLRLFKIIEKNVLQPVDSATLPIGKTAPLLAGRRASDGQSMGPRDMNGNAVVLVFLSTRCAKCKEKVPELLQIRSVAEQTGVQLWIIGNEDAEDLIGMLGDTVLLDRVLCVEDQLRDRLNPNKAAPAYIFIDPKNVVQASNYLGDEDWQSFVEQMRDRQ